MHFINRFFSFFFLFFSFSYAGVKEELINFYKKQYPNITITSIYTQTPFPKHYKNISFKMANPKYISGNLIIDNKYYFYRINAKLNVYKAQKIIRKNEPIAPYVKKEEINFRSFYSPPLLKISNNLIASKIISKNGIITKDNTRIKPAILKGDSVSVVFKGDTIDIYSKGKALNDANINDKVRVKIKSKIYEGILDKSLEVIVKWKY